VLSTPIACPRAFKKALPESPGTPGGDRVDGAAPAVAANPHDESLLRTQLSDPQT
jgi:hypothetical protein